jgi:hypothetical protein
MNHSDYAKVIDETELTFPENKITSCCEDFLRGIIIFDFRDS